MSLAIIMAQQNDLAIKTMCAEAVIQGIKLLAKEFNFDAEDAQRFLNLDELKITHLSINDEKPDQELKKDLKKDLKKAEKAEKDLKKAEKAKKKEANKDKPKRALTGYLLYLSDQRPVMKEMMEADLEEGKKLMSADVTVALAKLWSDLADDEKAEWNATAKANASEASSEASVEVS